MGLGAVLQEKPAHPDRALSPGRFCRLQHLRVLICSRMETSQSAQTPNCDNVDTVAIRPNTVTIRGFFLAHNPKRIKMLRRARNLPLVVTTWYVVAQGGRAVTRVKNTAPSG